MRKVIAATVLVVALGGCSTTPRPLVPDTLHGPTSYVCYNNSLSSPVDVRAVAERQCGRWGMQVNGLLGQEWTPRRCGVLTPTVAAFSCGR